MEFDPLDYLTGGQILLIALAVFLFVTILLGVRIVPQSEEHVVKRLGRFSRVLKPGVNLIVPYLDVVHARISVADQVISDVRLDVVSRDNVVFSLELLTVFRIVKPELAVFRVDDVRNLVIGLVKSLVRAEIGKVELDQVQQDRESLNEAIRLALGEAADDYGIVISRSEITDVQLTPETQRAMAEVLQAERSRRATITRAEGDKRAVELAAEAALFQQQREAEGLRVTADATAYSNRAITEAIAAGGLDAARFQIAELQIEAFRKLAESQNAKLIVLPGDATDGFTRAAAILQDGDKT
ncbi:MAG TPA: SPFH domain-containing protein [Paracoccaceae bacterium]|nr:SPFH domain-containing protein [Paracoccaceae bacterium]